MSVESDRVDRILAEWRRERPDADTTPMAIIGRVHRLADVLDSALAANFARFGLTRGEFDVLAALRRAGAPFERSAGELAAHTMITGGGLTKRVDRLAARGLVSRDVDPADARGRTISLTPTGRELVDGVLDAHLQTEQSLVGGLGDQADDLTAALRTWLLALGDGEHSR